MIMKIFVFGNPLLEEDSLPLKLMPFLRQEFPGIEFIEFDPTGNLSEMGRNPVIIDSVQGIEKVIIIQDTGQIAEGKPCSLHDFDLGLNLKLLKKIGSIDSVLVFGVPMKGQKEKIKKDLKEKINRFLIQNNTF